MRRREGGRSLAETAAQSGVELRWLNTMPLVMKHYRFARFDFGLAAGGTEKALSRSDLL